MGKKADKRRIAEDEARRQAEALAAAAAAVPVVDAEPVDPAEQALGGLAEPLAAAEAFRDALTSAVGAQLAYGAPVKAGERTIVPVARVSASGGGGGGGGTDPGRRSFGRGWGGGGSLETTPIGFIDIGPEGARFEAIPDPVAVSRTVKTGMRAFAAAAALLGAFALRRGGAGARRGLPRGR